MFGPYYEKNQKNVLDPGDIEEALNAAHQIGDDRLQKEYQGEVHPDSFTHVHQRPAHVLVQKRF